MSSIGSQVRTERELKGWSLTTLAAKAKISKGYLSQLEAGKQENPGLEVLKKIADALEITIGQLIGTETVAAYAPPPVEDPGLQELLEERRRRGDPVPQRDVQLLLQLQWRGGSRGERPRSKAEWSSFYEHILPMWDRSTGG